MAMNSLLTSRVGIRTWYPKNLTFCMTMIPSYALLMGSQQNQGQPEQVRDTWRQKGNQYKKRSKRSTKSLKDFKSFLYSTMNSTRNNNDCMLARRDNMSQARMKSSLWS